MRRKIVLLNNLCMLVALKLLDADHLNIFCNLLGLVRLGILQECI